MQGYLNKFNQLPEDIIRQASSPAVMRAISEIEKKYNISLATLIIRVLVKDIPLSNLHKNISYENSIEDRDAELVVKDLRNKVFCHFKEYLDDDDAKKFDTDYAWLAGKDKGTDNSARFFFSTEDEEEVEKYIKKAEGINPEEDNQAQVDAKIAKIVEELKISFSSEMLKNRLEKALATYIKGIRNRVVTKDNMQKPVEAGGLGLSEAAVDKIIKVTDKYKEIKFSESELGKGHKPPLQEKAQGGDDDYFGTQAPRDTPYDFSKLRSLIENGEQKEEIDANVKDKGLINIKEKEKKFSETDEKPSIKEASTPVPAVKEEEKESSPTETSQEKKTDYKIDLRKEADAKKEVVLEANIEKDDEKEKEEEDPAPAYKPINILNVNRITSGGKIKMQDVKHATAKLMGPVDELREMDLVNFRRLGSNPEEIVDKIEEKINFLEDESYSKRLEGIKAWRNSPTNRYYLNIGRDSIEKSMNIEEIIAQKKETEKECLTIDEFNAIMNLNKRLRY